MGHAQTSSFIDCRGCTYTDEYELSAQYYDASRDMVYTFDNTPCPSPTSYSSTASPGRRCAADLRLVGVQQKRWAFQAPEGFAPGEEALSSHHRPRAKTPAARRAIVDALRKSRLCSDLDVSDLEALMESMEYYTYQDGEYVFKEGCMGSNFFVAHTEGLTVAVRGGHVAALEPGQAFGELAMLDKVARSASVVATQADVGVWAVSASQVRQAVQSSVARKLASNRVLLEHVAIFEALTTDELDSVADACGLLTLQAGERLRVGAHSNGDSSKFLSPSHVFLVKAGSLRVLQRDGPASPPLLRPGCCIGERALLYGETVDIHVEATRSSELLAIDLSQLSGRANGDNVRSSSKGGVVRHCYVPHDKTWALRLQQELLLSAFRRSGRFTGMSRGHRLAAAKSMTSLCFKPGAMLELPMDEGDETLPMDSPAAWPPRFFVVVDGSVVLQAPDGRVEEMLQRGCFYGGEDDAELGSPGSPSACSPKPASISPFMRAGPEGCHLAVLPSAARLVSLRPRRGRRSVLEDDTVRLALVLTRMCIFQHLSPCQTAVLVHEGLRNQYKRGDVVNIMGENLGASTAEGDSRRPVQGVIERLCIVLSGEVSASLQSHSRQLFQQGSYLLCNAPGTSMDGSASPCGSTHGKAESTGCNPPSVEIVSDEAELFVLSRLSLEKVLRDSPQGWEQLANRIRIKTSAVALEDLQNLGVVGSGNHGCVNLVRNKIGSMYALKRVAKSKAKSVPLEVQREMQLLAEVDHPFVVLLARTFETATSVYMLTEYASGGELHAAIRTVETVLSRSQAMFYVGSLLLALEHLGQRRIVFRDLKPENVMLDSQGYLKLIDFGSAKKLEPGAKTFTKVGTPHYMAPEVIRGRGYDHIADLWALGIVLYELVCGQLPFGNDVDNTVDVVKAVLTGKPKFPPGVDEESRGLAAALLKHKPSSRLGSGAGGYDDVKDTPFFGLDGLGVSTSAAGIVLRGAPGNPEFFALLLSRELEAPIPPAEPKPPEVVSGRFSDSDPDEPAKEERVPL